MQHQILVVDDDEAWGQLFQTTLCEVGYRVVLTSTIEQAKSSLDKKDYDLVLFDVSLDQTNFNLLCQEFCEYIQNKKPNLPIFAVSGKALPPKEMATLFMKFHPVDFVSKDDIDISEFRNRIGKALAPSKVVYEFGPFRLEPNERRLRRKGKSLPIEAKLFDLLVALVRADGDLISYESLLNEVWADTNVERGTINVSIANLRKIIDSKHPGGPKYIENVRSKGYRFTAKDMKKYDF